MLACSKCTVVELGAVTGRYLSSAGSALVRHKTATRWLLAAPGGIYRFTTSARCADADFQRSVIIGSIRSTAVLPALASRSFSDNERHNTDCHRNIIRFENRRLYHSKMDQQLVLKLVASSVRIADRAGHIVRNIMSGGNLGIVDKGVNDLQTEADRSVQRCIVASLHKLYPRVKIIGEEGEEELGVGQSAVNADWIETSLDETVLAHSKKLPSALASVADEEVCIWVDPLDGTAEYTQGLLDHVTVLIGIAVNGQAVAGVIHQPYFNYKLGPDAQLGRTIWGIVGLGSFGFDMQPPNPAERIVVTTRSHGTDAVRNAIAACEPTSVLKVGGAGHKVLLLIEGKAHAYIFASPGCKKWDTCGPEAVLRAIGGTLTDMHGNKYRYDQNVAHPNSGGVLGTAQGQSHDWFLSKIPDEVKNSLPANK